MSELNFYSTEKTGLLADLDTTEQGTLVGAINENAGEISEIKADLLAFSDVTFFDVSDSGYIATNVAAGGTVDSTVVSNSSFVHTTVTVTEGTYITLNGKGWTTGRLWCFVDDDYTVISVSGTTVTADNLILTVPSGATKLIINMYKIYVGSCFVGVPAVAVDSTLSVEGAAADALATGDAIESLENVCETVEYAYEDVEQGLVSVTNGSVSTSNTTAVYCGKFDLLSVKSLVKPSGYRLLYALFDEYDTFVYGGYKVQTIDYSDDDFGATMYTAHPTAQKIYICFRYYGSSSTAVDFAPTDYASSGCQVFINNAENWNASYEITQKLNNFIIEDTTLTSSLSFDIPNTNLYNNMILSIDATNDSSNTDECTIRATRSWLNGTGTSTNQYYGSPYYALGAAGERVQKQFRFPCGVYGMSDTTFTLTVPDDCSITIHSLSIDYDNTVSRESHIQLNAHGYNGYGGPANTNVSFNMAAKLGYKYCITIPKVTSDGVYVCFHDDDNVQDLLRNSDGTAIASEYQDRPVSDLTYAELTSFDAGVIRGQIFQGEKVPLVEDFFKICAETGMHPMFSVHPAMTTTDWENIKALAVKYNVLDKLNIKAPWGSTFTTPMSVLLNDIESYTVDMSTSGDAVDYLETTLTTYSIDTTKVKIGIEWFLAYATDENIEATLDAGYFAAVANITSSADVYEQYTTFIEKGVTQFTDDFLPCVGLRWY